MNTYYLFFLMSILCTINIYAGWRQFIDNKYKTEAARYQIPEIVGFPLTDSAYKIFFRPSLEDAYHKSYQNRKIAEMIKSYGNPQYGETLRKKPELPTLIGITEITLRDLPEGFNNTLNNIAGSILKHLNAPQQVNLINFLDCLQVKNKLINRKCDNLKQDFEKAIKQLIKRDGENSPIALMLYKLIGYSNMLTAYYQDVLNEPIKSIIFKEEYRNAFLQNLIDNRVDFLSILEDFDNNFKRNGLTPQQNQQLLNDVNALPRLLSEVLIEQQKKQRLRRMKP